MSELNVLYDLYMDRCEEEIATTAAFHAAEANLRATPQWQILEAAREQQKAAAELTASALSAVKAAVIAAFQESGDKQPHPYAGICRVDLKARYLESDALMWVKARPDFAHLVIPEHLNAKGFEKVARKLREADIPIRFASQDEEHAEIITWEESLVVSVKIREE